MKILITGGKGFLGTRFKKMWENKYDIYTPGIQELDITDELKVDSYITELKPDYVIHAAGIPSQQFCIDNPEKAQAVNVDGAIYVAKACDKVNAKMVFISTEQVFNGSKEKGPYDEQSTPCPDTVYGSNKMEVENNLSKYINDYWVVRFTWLFGLPQIDCAMGPNILWDTINSLITNKQIVVSEYEYRGMSDVNEICKNLVRLFEAPFGTYNFGSTNNCSRYEIVRYILELLGLSKEEIDSKVLIENGKYSKENIRELRMSTEKLNSVGITFKPTKEAIENCLKQFSIIK